MRPRSLIALLAAIVLVSGCGGSDDDAAASPARFCAALSTANNNDAFINIHNQYFTDWNEMVGLIDPVEESPPPEISADVERLAALVDQIAGADLTGITGDPTQVLAEQDLADLVAATAAIDAYAAANCGFTLRQ